MTEATLDATPHIALRDESCRRALGRFLLGDLIFRNATRAAAVFVLLLLGGVIVSLVIGSMPALRTFGLGFLTTQSWNPVTEKFGAIAPIYGTVVTSLIAMLIGIPVSIGIAIFLTEVCPYWLRRPIGTAIELLAGIPSIIYGIWGLFVFAPFLQATVQPFLIDLFADVPVLNTLFAGPPYGIGIFTAGLILAIMVLPFITAITRDVFETVPPVVKEAAYGMGCTTWEVVRNDRAALHPRRRHRRRHARSRPRARRDHGGYLRHRQRPPHLRFDPGAGHDDLRHHRQ